LHNDRTVNVAPPFGDRRTIALPNPSEPGPQEPPTVTLPLNADRTVDLPVQTNREPGAPGDPPSLAAVIVPGYEIVRELGRGGMGVVYLARHLATEQLVALKMVLGGFGASETDRERFLREARALVHLDQPNIVRVLEVGEVRGQPFLCLEYVAGGTLANHLRGVPQAPVTGARLIRTLAQAMQTAHEQGIIHRDLKPGNILLADPEPEEREPGPAVRLPAPGLLCTLSPKVADFGLAKHLDGDGERSRTGWIIGTPCYMAPEQAAGKVREIGPAADIYALGAILYECLTGRPPYSGTTALETLNLVQRGELVPPRQLNPGVPRDLETICLKCLRKEPEKRYASMNELVDDLDRFLQGQPIQARRPSTAEECQRWIRRNATLFVLLLTIGVSLFLLVLNRLWHSWSLADALAKTEYANKQYRLERERSLRNQQLLEERDTQLREHFYAANIQLAQHLWAQGDIRSMREVLQPYQNDPSRPRDFACRYLEKLLQGDLATLLGHRGDVYSLAWSPDGSQLASVGKDGQLRFWDMPEGQLRQAIQAHTDDINSVAWSPDGRLVATAGDDGRVGLWDAATGHSLSEISDPKSEVRGQVVQMVSVVFSADGKRLITGDAKGNLVQWTLAKDEGGRMKGEQERGRGGAQVSLAAVGQSTTVLPPPPSFRKLAEFGARIEQVVRSVDGRWLAAAVGDKGVALLDLNAPARPPRVFATNPAQAESVAFSPSGTSLAVGRNDGSVVLFDLATGEAGAPLVGHLDVVAGLDFTRDGELLISGGQDSSIALWDASGPPKNNEPRGFLRGHCARVWCVAVSPDGRTIASSSGNGDIKLWATSPRPEFTTVRDVGHESRALALLPGVPLAILATDHDVQVTPLSPGRHAPARQVPTLAGADQAIRAGAGQSITEPANRLAVSPDGRHLLATQGKGKVVLYDLVAGTNRTLFKSGHDLPPVAFSSDGQFACAGDNEGQVHVWRMPGAEPVPVRARSSSVIHSLAFQPGTHRLAIGSELGWVSLWELDGQEPLSKWHAHQGDVFRLAFNSKGTVLATAGRDRVARLWDVERKQEIHHGLMGQRQPVVDVAFSPDGLLVVTGSQGGVVRLWSVTTGRELLVFQQPGPIAGVGFVDNNRLLVTGTGTGKKGGYLRLYTAAPE
jgi:WD40 repeat protein/serine/threonine protein kinase